MIVTPHARYATMAAGPKQGSDGSRKGEHACTDSQVHGVGTERKRTNCAVESFFWLCGAKLGQSTHREKGRMVTRRVEPFVPAGLDSCLRECPNHFSRGAGVDSGVAHCELDTKQVPQECGDAGDSFESWRRE